MWGCVNVKCACLENKCVGCRRHCFVDQNEMNVGIFETTRYPRGTVCKSRPSNGPSPLQAKSPLLSTSFREYSRKIPGGIPVPKLRPQSISWTEGFVQASKWLQTTKRRTSSPPLRPDRSLMIYEQMKALNQLEQTTESFGTLSSLGSMTESSRWNNDLLSPPPGGEGKSVRTCGTLHQRHDSLYVSTHKI